MKKNRRKINPDVKYGDYTIQRLINSLMWDGKKTVAEKIVYDAIDLLKEDESVPKELSVSDVMKRIMSKTKPVVEVVSRRVRGATYPVPCEVKHRRAEMLALRWLKQGARNRGREMHVALSRELIDAFNETGYAIKQRDQLHSMAKANRAFSHFGGAR